jgi:hypothetical protein
LSEPGDTVSRRLQALLHFLLDAALDLAHQGPREHAGRRIEPRPREAHEFLARIQGNEVIINP